MEKNVLFLFSNSLSDNLKLFVYLNFFLIGKYLQSRIWNGTFLTFSKPPNNAVLIYCFSSVALF